MGYMAINGQTAKDYIKLGSLVTAWIVLSASVVLVNKYILTYTPFKYVFALALAHMLGATSLCKLAFFVRPGLRLYPPDSDAIELQWRFGVIAGLFAASLLAANGALSRLDVASVQMIKAINPVVIYVLGVVAKVERPSWSIAGALAIICGGVAYAVKGAVKLHPLGCLLQLLATLADSTRHLYIQATLQSYTEQLDAINALDMIAPIASAFLWTAGSFIEFPHMRLDPSDLARCLPLMLYSCILAFALNVSSYAYIKATSALTMSVSGIIKDVLMIVVSVAYFGSAFRWNQCLGYGTAVVGTMCYKRLRDIAAQSVPEKS
jgi:hypothetical protein